LKRCPRTLPSFWKLWNYYLSSTGKRTFTTSRISVS
jgi:hypothetical protein